MRLFKRSAINLGVTALLSLSALAISGTASALPAGWNCDGNCGELGADGVVTTSPDGGNYLYVSTTNAPTQAGLNIGSETTGSVLRSTTFSASAGDSLQYYFNYVTTDGSGFADYAWSRLFNASDNSLVALLFTARTTPGGNTVPGFGMPAISATMEPASVGIIPGSPTWQPVGSGCYAEGCGYTGWIKSTYDILADGDYYLDFGVVNWSDSGYQSGLAIDGILIGGNPIDASAVPEPGTVALLSLGLFGLGALRRRQRA